MNIFDFYNGHTKVYGIIGNPIEHSFSSCAPKYNTSKNGI